MRADLKKLYNETDNNVDLNSGDFASVIAYLKSYSLPDPMVTSDEVGWVGGTYVDVELLWTHAGMPPLRQEAYVTMNAPSLAVTMYYMWLGAPPPIITEYAPPLAVAPPPMTTKPSVLVGPVIYGNKYQPVTGDDSPNGTQYSDERGTFAKIMVATPFGNSVYWAKVS